MPWTPYWDSLFKREQILKLNDLYKLQCVKIVYKKIHNKPHPYLSSRLLTNLETTKKHTRKSDDIHIHEIDKSLATVNSINLKVGTVWNDLDSEIKNKAHTVTIATFNKDVKKSYISRYSDVCIKENCYTCDTR